MVLKEFCDKSQYINDKQNIKQSVPGKEKKLGKTASIDSSTTLSDKNQISAWETLVLFGVNFTKLNVQMNMGNVMGNVVSTI